jgi:hypothetical protein
MATIRKPKWGNLAANIKTRIETKVLYDGLESEDFIINVYDGGKGGIFKKMSADPWDGIMGALQPGAAPYPKGYYGSLEGQTGDVVEFQTAEIGAGAFAQGAKVYAIVAADLTCTITDASGDGRFYIGTVEIPLFSEGANKFVYVSLAKSGEGFVEMAA